MAILAASAPPRPRQPYTYGSTSRRASTTNPSKPFKSPLPRDGDLPPVSPTKVSASSPMAASSSQLSSPPALPVKRVNSSDLPPADSEEDMDMEEMKVDDERTQARGHVAEDEGETEDEDEEDESEEDEDDDRPIVHIEARIRHGARCLPYHIESIVKSFMIEYAFNWITPGEPLSGWEDVTALQTNLESLVAAEISNDAVSVRTTDVDFEVHVYTMSTEADGVIAGELSDGDEDEDKDDRTPSAAQTKSLPSEDLDDLWGNLVYPDNLKERLLQYIYSSMFFSEKEISSGVVNWSRLILLHGPPGTGKTSLCRALAQKIAIRLQPEYQSTNLVEINSHSLFSKWFSESGKLVQKLFSHVTDMADTEGNFVIVMIDEVESLTGSRTSGGTEPGDALRVVNAVLTQLDKLKQRENVLVLTTSNLSHAIDNAFIDRADIKEYVPLPPPEAIYWMIRSCFLELMDKEAMRSLDIPKWLVANNDYELQQKRGGLKNGNHVNGTKPSKAERTTNLGIGLARLAYRCHEYRLSGRVLRRMPMMAHTRYIGRQKRSASISVYKPEKWLEAMEKFVEVEQQDREKIGWDRDAME